MALTTSSTSLLAYGCRYRTPYNKHLLFLSLSYNTFPRHHHHHRHFHLHLHHRPLLLPRVLTARFPKFSLFTACCSPFSTGSSLFSRMERHFSGGNSSRNKVLVDQLKRYGIIRSEKVSEVMETIDRGLFVPEGTPAYVDSPMPIGHNATISAPHMHAMCLDLLKDNLQPGMHALDVGSDGRQGWPDAAPYDAIHVGAAAPEIPEALIEQLKPGGRLVIPVGTLFQDLQVVDKKQDGSLSIRTETSVRYVPLTSREAQLRG